MTGIIAIFSIISARSVEREIIISYSNMNTEKFGGAAR